jgi:DNA polymerase-3 subunit gamma/tau
MYQVLARKWRPQSFDQLIGQSHVVRTLSNAVAADRLAHAYIFAGLRGTGKTTVARILAKCLNCEKGPTVTPCQQCAPCVEIAESRAIDVLEIDAASRTKVEQTRELLEVVSYAPVRDRYKILIIDEAHMLSKASFNALLKTLEEPPPNVLFLLATTELQRILPTIHSRCQVFEFRRVGTAEVAARLREICDGDSVEIPDVALERLARAGEGSVRDSLSLLERALAFCGDCIADEDVLRMLGAVRSEVLAEMVRALAERDAGGMLRVLDALLDEGHDLLHFWNAMVAAVRDLLLARTLPERGDLLSRPPAEAAALVEAAAGFSREDLVRVFQILADLEPALKASAHPRYLFEAALIRLASLGAVRPIEDVLQSLDAGAAAPRPSAPAPRQKKKAAEPPVVARPAPRGPGPDGPPPARTVRATGDAVRLVDAVRRSRPMLAAVLEQARIRLSGDAAVIRFPPGMEAVKRQLESRESLELLGREARRIAGEGVEVRIEISGADPAADADARPHGRGAARGTPRESKPGGLVERARNEPGVRRLMDALGAHVVDVRRCDGPAQPTGAGRDAGPPEDAG